MRQRPGFVSATGIVLAIAVLAGVLAVAVFAGPQLFSPGGLNAQTGARTAAPRTAAAGRDPRAA